jgi:hypothetical protein
MILSSLLKDQVLPLHELSKGMKQPVYVTHDENWTNAMIFNKKELLQ